MPWGSGGEGGGLAFKAEGGPPPPGCSESQGNSAQVSLALGRLSPKTGSYCFLPSEGQGGCSQLVFHVVAGASGGVPPSTNPSPETQLW